MTAIVTHRVIREGELRMWNDQSGLNSGTRIFAKTKTSPNWPTR